MTDIITALCILVDIATGAFLFGVICWSVMGDVTGCKVRTYDLAVWDYDAKRFHNFRIKSWLSLSIHENAQTIGMVVKRDHPPLRNSKFHVVSIVKIEETVQLVTKLKEWSLEPAERAVREWRESHA